jgi:hypothetical protein
MGLFYLPDLLLSSYSPITQSHPRQNKLLLQHRTENLERKQQPEIVWTILQSHINNLIIMVNVNFNLLVP